MKRRTPIALAEAIVDLFDQAGVSIEVSRAALDIARVLVHSGERATDIEEIARRHQREKAAMGDGDLSAESDQRGVGAQDLVQARPASW